MDFLDSEMNAYILHPYPCRTFHESKNQKDGCHLAPPDSKLDLALVF